jgi:DNA-binding NarL/FixJ family response regulator
MVRLITVLLVDDHASVRRGLRMRLHREPGIVVAGEAEDGQQALELAQELRPDVVVVDLQLPGLDGLDVSERLHGVAPESAAVMLSLYDDEVNRARAAAAGAAAFVGKQEPTETLLAAIRDAAARA